MTAKQFVSMGLAYAKMTQAQLSAQLGWTPQLFNSRLKVGKFTLEEWEAIAAGMGAELEINFKFKDGKRV